MVVHVQSQASGVVSAGTPEEQARKAAFVMYPRAVKAGLMDELLACAKARTDAHHWPEVKERLVRNVPRAGGAEALSDDERDRLNLALGHISQDLLKARAGVRARPVPAEVDAAAARLIRFVQHCYGLAGVGHALPQMTALELRGTQRHAFEALRRRSRGNARARALLLELTSDRPLQACRACWVVFEDNPSPHGPMAEKCPSCRGGE